MQEVIAKAVGVGADQVNAVFHASVTDASLRQTANKLSLSATNGNQADHAAIRLSMMHAAAEGERVLEIVVSSLPSNQSAGEMLSKLNSMLDMTRVLDEAGLGTCCSYTAINGTLLAPTDLWENGGNGLCRDDCGAGFFRQGCGPIVGTCEACPEGTYSEATDDVHEGPSFVGDCSSCDDLTCGVGFKRVGCGGATRGQCVQCEAGTYNDNDGPSTTCTECPSCGAPCTPCGRLECSTPDCREAEAGEASGSCATLSEQQAVTCCSDVEIVGWRAPDHQATPNCPVWATRHGSDDDGMECNSEATYEEAIAFCQAHGGRLCSVDELVAECGRLTGCSMDNKLMWAASADTAECPVPDQVRMGCGDHTAGECANCDGGMFAGAGATRCSECQGCDAGAGRAQCAGGNPGTCVVCPSGSFMTSGRASRVVTADNTCEACVVCDPPAISVGCGFDAPGHCEVCADGSYLPSGQTTCEPCAPCGPGTVRQACALSNSGTCVACADTHYEVNGTCVECDACPAGQARYGCGGASQGDCSACSARSYKSTRGSHLTECVDCLTPGSAAYNNTPVCDVAEEFFGCGAQSPGACRACGAGEWASAGICYACESCHAGTMRSGCAGGNPGNCVLCGPGSYKSEEGVETCSQCESCPIGHERVGCGELLPGQCLPCNSGYFADQGDTTECTICPACPVGEERLGCGGADEGSCHTCAATSFKLVVGAADTICQVCETCDVGTYRHGCGGGSNGECVACPTLTFKLAGHEGQGDDYCSPCPSCPNGMLRVGCGGGSMGVCLPCPDHTYKTTGHEVLAAEGGGGLVCDACDVCEAGYMRHGCGSTSVGTCLACPSGMFSTNASVACDTCQACEVGYDRIGCGVASPGFCAACPLNSYKESTGTYMTQCRTCSPCPDGFVRTGCGAGSAGTCSRCADSTTWVAPAEVGLPATCYACPSCPAGEYRVACGNGGLSDGECVSCPIGSYTPTSHAHVRGAEACQPCPACGAGYRREGCHGTDQGVCVACSLGTFKKLATSGDQAISQCSPCEFCGAGTQRVGCGGGSSGECQSCPRSTFQSTLANATSTCAPCTMCESGTQRGGCEGLGSVEAGVCHQCLMAQHWNGTHCVECEACAAGERRVGCGADNAGACVACSVGTFKTSHGLSITRCEPCQPCNEGEFREGCGSTSDGECAPCPPGTFSDISSDSGPSACKAHTGCDAGLYRIGQTPTSQGTCAVCPSGTFKTDGPVVGQPLATCQACAACPVGEERVGCGGTSEGTCVICPSGSWGAAHMEAFDIASVLSCSDPAVCTCGEDDTRTMQENPADATRPKPFLQDTTEDACRVACLSNSGCTHMFWHEDDAHSGTCHQYESCTSTRTPDFAGTNMIKRPPVSGEPTCTICLPCAAGMVRRGCEGGSGGVCEVCGADTFKADEGTWTTTCDPCPVCPAGTRQAQCTANSSGTCEMCAANSYSVQEGATTCTPCAGCDAGMYRKDCGASTAGVCAPCPSGSHKNATADGAGSGGVSGGTDACQPCPDGTYQADVGQATCDECGDIHPMCDLNEGNSETSFYCTIPHMCNADTFQVAVRCRGAMRTCRGPDAKRFTSASEGVAGVRMECIFPFKAVDGEIMYDCVADDTMPSPWCATAVASNGTYTARDVCEI